jgi:hypothetical protein
VSLAQALLDRLNTQPVTSSRGLISSASAKISIRARFCSCQKHCRAGSMLKWTQREFSLATRVLLCEIPRPRTLNGPTSRKTPVAYCGNNPLKHFLDLEGLENVAALVVVMALVLSALSLCFWLGTGDSESSIFGVIVLPQRNSFRNNDGCLGAVFGPDSARGFASGGPFFNRTR